MALSKTPVVSVSVIIPALNESLNIASCIAAAHRDPAIAEVIVVDGGSSDTTVSIALAAGAQVLVHRRPLNDGGGRGGQILAGIREAKSDIIAIVHADAIPEPGAFSEISQTLRDKPGIIGGAAGCRFDAQGIRFRLLEHINSLRVILTGISFGDQIQFFRRVPIVEDNVFPPIPLMEDVEFSIRLRRHGKTIFLRQHNLASTRRWETRTWWKSLQVNLLLVEYLVRRLWSQPDVVVMYNRYYGSGYSQAKLSENSAQEDLDSRQNNS